MIDVPFLSLVFSFGMSVKGLALALFKSKDDQGRFFLTVALHTIGEFFFVLDELDLHIHLLAGGLNLAQEKQVFDKREDAGSGIGSRDGQRIGIDHRYEDENPGRRGALLPLSPFWLAR